MHWLVLLSRIVIAAGLLNVWVLRRARPTVWWGGEASDMRQEFEVYGLPEWFMRVVGFLKVTLALLLLVGIWIPVVTRCAAIGIGILMLGAVSMHVKVHDPAKKSLPALLLLGLSALVAFG